MSGTWFKTLRVTFMAGALGLAVAGRAQAQSATIRGTVVSDGGQPIASASVFIQELGVVAATTENGRYTLLIPGERVRNQQLYLRVRAIGYRPSSRLVTVSSGEQTADFTLTTDINRLEEIVVTGTLEGTEAGKVPFAVSHVDVADIPVPAVDPLRMLAGRVPGATIMSNNGRPGQMPSVLLRGPTSINGQGRSLGPLYIVDGVILSGDNLPDINPSDIENVEVVKGAAAASLYGARAGAGVIQITTKSGRRASDGMSFNLASEYGQNDIERQIQLAQATAMLLDPTNQRFCTNRAGAPLCNNTIDWNTEAARINNVPGDFAGSPASFPLDPGSGGAGSLAALSHATVSTLWPGRIYNPVNAVVTPGEFNNTTADATGRYNNTQFYGSLGYLRQAGAIRFMNGYTRYSGRLNVDQRLSDKMNLSIRSFYSNSTSDGFDQQVQNASLWFWTTRTPAIVNELQRDTLGRLYVRPSLQSGATQNGNPLVQASSQKDVGGTDRFIGSTTFRYQMAPWADLEANGSYDLQNYTQDFFQDKGYRTQTSNPTANNGRVRVYASRTEAYNGSLNLTLRGRLSTNVQTRWNFRALYDAQNFKDQQADGTGGLIAVGVPETGNATQTTLTSASSNTYVREVGLNAGVNVDFFDGKYVVEGLLRRDGTSLFGAENRWATFGRLSLSWRPSQESWWFGGNTVNDFRVRFSRGSAGGRPSYSAQYETFGIASSGGIVFQNQGNANLRPEVTTDNEAGIDAELYHRIGLQVTYDASRTVDQILQVPLPAEKGFGQQWRNAGTLSNKSFELALNVPLMNRHDVNWQWRFTYDRNKTMVDALDVPPFTFGGGTQGNDNMFLLKQGEEYGTFYGHRFITDCSQLPDMTLAGGPNFSSSQYCGGANTMFQKNSDGLVVWTGGHAVTAGITSNLWGTTLVGANGNAQTPWGTTMFWGMPLIMRDTACTRAATPLGGGPKLNCSPLNVPIGHALPHWSFSVQQNFTWKRLSLFAMAQGVMDRNVYNEAAAWSHLDFLTKDLEQRNATVQSAHPLGYYWRTSSTDGFSGLGGFYDQLAANSWFVQDGSFIKLRELSASYNVGPVAGTGNWTVAVIGRNLYTITNYTGFDPEVGRNGGLTGNGVINAVDAFIFPNTRSLTVRLSTSF